MEDIFVNDTLLETRRLYPADAQIVMFGVHLVLTAVLLPGFMLASGQQFIPITRRRWLLLLNVLTSLISSYSILAKHVYGGMQCFAYEFLNFVSPSIIAGCCIVNAMEITSEIQYISGGRYGSKVWGWIWRPEVMRRRAWIIMVINVLASCAIVGATLGVRFGGRFLLAFSDSCQLGMEINLLLFMFIVYMVLLISTAISHGTRPPRMLRLAVWHVRLLVLWDIGTLLPFIVLNMMGDSTFSQFEENVFSVEVFGMLFFMGQSVISLGFTQAASLYLDGGTFLCLTFRGDTYKMMRDAVSDSISLDGLGEAHDADEQDMPGVTTVAVTADVALLDEIRRIRIAPTPNEVRAMAAAVSLLLYKMEKTNWDHGRLLNMSSTLSAEYRFAVLLQQPSTTVLTDHATMGALAEEYDLQFLRELSQAGQKLVPVDTLRSAVDEIALVLLQVLNKNITVVTTDLAVAREL